MSDDQLRDKTAEFQQRLAKAGSLVNQRPILDEILPEAFAVVREAGKRVLGMRHFDVQLIGGMVLHEGQIAEMKTGEGKTLVATLPSYLNAHRKGCSRRDGERLPGSSRCRMDGPGASLPGSFRWFDPAGHAS